MDTFRYIKAVNRPEINTHRTVHVPVGGPALSKQADSPQAEVMPQGLYTIDEGDPAGDRVNILSIPQHQEFVEWEKKDARQRQGPDSLVILSTSELKLLNTTIVKKIEVMPPYISPPNTPTSADQGQYLDEETKQQIKNAKGLDLLNLLRSQPAWHAVSITNDPALFNARDNLSDYYHMPVIEDPRADEDDLDLCNLSISSASDSILSDSDEITLNPPRRMSHPQSIILYLFGKGQSEWDIAKILGFFEEKFFEVSSTCVYKDIIIPAHWDLNDRIVAKLKEVCVPEENLHPWWEGEFDKQGLRIPKCFRALQRLARARPITIMVEETVEEYLYYRLATGE
ncbi:uncharacterized protein BP5553_05469 [Venustampulla echinocandica]|uniref:Uncharacterized protein n=1 Tax=Venustampulla echinocandica TaxID=2656787 RepID=A0A370TR81_9HELO|nr:uncharacterized protein BP5553_05469 [Venustampulla echinocandica]RDL38036.1 hypothetical protein BP5553_05469 [Venustampulla echinocandica]